MYRYCVYIFFNINGLVRSWKLFSEYTIGSAQSITSKNRPHENGTHQSLSLLFTLPNYYIHIYLGIFYKNVYKIYRYYILVYMCLYIVCSMRVYIYIYMRFLYSNCLLWWRHYWFRVHCSYTKLHTHSRMCWVGSKYFSK